MDKKEFINKRIINTTNVQNNDYKNNLTVEEKIEYLTNIIIETNNNLESIKKHVKFNNNYNYKT